jgi:ribosomal protein S18 acetylase RimI-like enzyme
MSTAQEKTGAIEVKRADLSQLDSAVGLFQGYLRFYQKSVAAEDARRFIEDRLRNRDSVIFIAFVDGAALGFMQLYPSFASLSLAPSWILNDLFVTPDARGLGVGETLMQAARELGIGNGAAEIFLQTARTNAKAQRLYEKLGYQRDDEFLVYTLGLPAHSD